MGRDTIQLETAVSTISSEYLLEFTSEYGIAEELHPELPSPGDRIVDFPEGKVGVYTRVFPTAVDWRISAPKDEMPVVGSYSLEDVVVINTRRTPIQKQPEALLCLVGLSRRYFLGDDVYPTFFYDDNREMDLFNLISALNSTKETPADVSDPDPLSYAKPQSIPEWKIAQSSKGATVVGDPDSEKSTSFTSFTRSPNGIYQPGWGVTNSFRLESSDVCRDVAKGSTRGPATDDSHEKVLRNQTKNLEALLEAEADMKKDTEAKNIELAEELESLRAKFLDLQVNYTQLSQQVSSLQAQIIGEERIKAAFEEFKRYEDDKVEQWCA
ncbi:hypothetical protein Tco_0831307 [Tanacetum coccineum]